jgi:DNA invertase Pin-like site-specific DNA recombinase
MTKAFAYLRVSGKGQVDGDGFPRQLAAIQQYAKTQDLEIVDVYREKAVPGATEWDNRPAWLAMTDRIIKNGVRAIIIERLDRLARDLMVQEHIIADLRQRGVKLVSVYEPDLGSDDPTRVLMRQIMGAIAQYDKSVIVLKLRHSRQSAKAVKGRCEGQKPYGHHEGEAEILEFIRERGLCRGDSPTAIARMLNDEGCKPRSGKKWHPYAVSRILGRQK